MSEKNKIFRKAALERLASPDQIDQPINIISTKGWIALLLLLASIAGFIAWVISAEAPIKIEAQGIIIKRDGLNQIIASEQGRLASLSITPNSQIQAGDIIATFEQPELQRDLEQTQADLTDANAKYKSQTTFYKNKNSREDKVKAERLSTIKKTQRLLKSRLNVLKKKVSNISKLVNRKIVIDDVLIKAQLSLSDAKEKMANLEDESKLIAIDKQDRLSKQNQNLLNEQLSIKQLERSVRRLKDKLAEKRVMRSPHSGKIIEIMVNSGDVITSGQAIATVTTSNNDNTPLYALIYINPKDGKRIRPNMTVEIVPTAFQQQEFGHMLGKVESISDLPITIESISRTLKNKRLAETLTTFGAPFEAKVIPIKDPETPSGYQWSSSKGPNTSINAGMLLNSKIIVDRVRLINLAIPQFDRLIGRKGE